MDKTNGRRPLLRLPKWPDVRGWGLIAAVALTYKLLDQMGRNPALLANASYMQFATLVASGTLVLVYANLYGGTKSGTEAQAKATDTLQTLAASAGTGPGVSVGGPGPGGGPQAVNILQGAPADPAAAPAAEETAP